MKPFTIKTIRSFDPCYNPSRHLPEDWHGTVLDILQHDSIPDKDKLWVVLRTDLLNDKVLRLFAVDCARRALSRTASPDQRSINACDVAERFANGQATREELTGAQSAAAAAAAAAAAVYAADYAAAYIADYAAHAAAAAAAAAVYAADYAAARPSERTTQVASLILIVKENI